jgi:hypothetical protein
MIVSTLINIVNRFPKTAFLLISLLGSFSLMAQENPPVPITVEVRTARNLDFGSFVAGSAGGDVIVDYSGTRTYNNDIFLLNMGSGTVSSALFDVFANPGTIVYIQDNGETVLTNGNGGEIYLTVDSFSTGDRTFVTSAASAQIPNEIFVGGTLRIPANNSGNLPGRYNGTFMLTFFHQ